MLCPFWDWNKVFSLGNAIKVWKAQDMCMSGTQKRMKAPRSFRYGVCFMSDIDWTELLLCVHVPRLAGRIQPVDDLNSLRCQSLQYQWWLENRFFKRCLCVIGMCTQLGIWDMKSYRLCDLCSGDCHLMTGDIANPPLLSPPISDQEALSRGRGGGVYLRSLSAGMSSPPSSLQHPPCEPLLSQVRVDFWHSWWHLSSLLITSSMGCAMMVFAKFPSYSYCQIVVYSESW